MHHPFITSARISHLRRHDRAQVLPDLDAPPPGMAPQLVSVEGFAAAAAFQGARPGFVFKSGSAGVGYYPDARR